MSLPDLLPPLALRTRLHALAVVPDDVDRTPPARDAPDELELLSKALAQHASACRGDDRFTADASSLTAADAATMRAACIVCPVWPACDAYARAARPPVGFWASRPYPRREEEYR